MQVIETLSVEQAAAALGLRPAAIRLRIKSGDLAAAFVGRKWRVGTASVNALLADAAPVQSAPAVAAVAQVVAQRPAEPSPEPVSDFNTVWVAAMNRRPCDDPPYTEAEKQWLRELTGREPRSNATQRLGSPSLSRSLF
jgi:excisionase family DNA binding protein